MSNQRASECSNLDTAPVPGFGSSSRTVAHPGIHRQSAPRSTLPDRAGAALPERSTARRDGATSRDAGITGMCHGARRPPTPMEARKPSPAQGRPLLLDVQMPAAARSGLEPAGVEKLPIRRPRRPPRSSGDRTLGSYRLLSTTHWIVATIGRGDSAADPSGSAPAYAASCCSISPAAPVQPPAVPAAASAFASLAPRAWRLSEKGEGL